MKLRLLIIICLFFSIGSIAAWFIHAPGSDGFMNTRNARSPIGGAFSLEDVNGVRVTDKSFRGKLMLVYFGYARSPDLTPAGLQVITTVLDKLGPGGNRVETLFITLDPEQDTQKQLAKLLENYHQNIRGLRGGRRQTDDVARSYRVYHEKMADISGTGPYLLRHSAYIYLMDREGRYLKHFNHGVGPEAILKTMRKHL